jgi:hypothetical protein
MSKSSGSTRGDERSAKLRRLNDLRASLPYVSQSALAAFLASARRCDLPDVGQTRDVREARDMVAEQITPYGPLIESVRLVTNTAATVALDITNPHAYIFVAAQCAMFSALLISTFDRCPCSAANPWRLIIYADEATPGNAMKLDNLRILQCVHWSILEFGAAALAKEDFWLVATTVGSKLVRSVSGGMSQLMAAVLKNMFASNGHNMHTAGISVVLNDGSTLRLFIKLSAILCDESALHGIWMCKGAAGIKPCLECRFIVNSNWQAADELDEDDDLVLMTKVFDVRKCKRHNKHTIHAIIDDLASAKPLLSNPLFAEKEKRLGFSHCEHGILQDPELRDVVDPSEHNVFDWAHNILQGAFQRTLWQLLLVLATCGIKMSDLHDYLQAWTWPKRVDGNNASGKCMFNPRRVASMKHAKNCKCSMSEALSIAPVLAHWVRYVILPHAGMHGIACFAFLYLVDLISLLQYAPLGLSPRWKVEMTTTHFLSAFESSLGADEMTTKFHLMLHHGRYVGLFRWSPNTMTLERKHQRIMQFGSA